MMLSPEFCTFALYFIQDMDLVATNEEEMYDFVLGPFQGADRADARARLQASLDALTDESVSDVKLEKIWWSSDADVIFADGGALRAMLKGARARL